MTTKTKKLSATELVAHHLKTPEQVTLPDGEVRGMNSYERAKVRRYLNRSGAHAKYADVAPPAERS